MSDPFFAACAARGPEWERWAARVFECEAQGAMTALSELCRHGRDGAICPEEGCDHGYPAIFEAEPWLIPFFNFKKQGHDVPREAIRD